MEEEKIIEAEVIETPAEVIEEATEEITDEVAEDVAPLVAESNEVIE